MPIISKNEISHVKYVIQNPRLQCKKDSVKVYLKCICFICICFSLSLPLFLSERLNLTPSHKYLTVAFQFQCF